MVGASRVELAAVADSPAAVPLEALSGAVGAAALVGTDGKPPGALTEGVLPAVT